MPWRFGFYEASSAGDSTVGFDGDCFRIVVYKLGERGNLIRKESRSLTYDEFGSSPFGFPFVLNVVDRYRTAGRDGGELDWTRDRQKRNTH